MESAPPRQASPLLAAAAFVVVVAGLKAAAALVIPCLLAVFIAVICAPILLWLESRKVPTSIALFVVVTGVIVLLVVLGLFIGTTIAEFTRALPGYQAGLREASTGWLDALSRLGIEITADQWREIVNPGRAMGLVGNLLSGLGGLLANGLLILLTTVFILLEVASFPRKLGQVVSDPEGFAERMGRVLENVKRYLAIKTVTSLATGGMVAGALAVIGVDFPLVWGLLAFLFNFVPSIGSIIAAIPAVLLALVQLGSGWALVVAAIYLAVNIGIGSFTEPRLMGKGLGLSTLVVFVSLVFWGWVLGPVGMLLSVPLTMTVKIALEADEQTHWIAVLLGPARIVGDGPPQR
ncbi:MAG: AI-2E family transporter [Myxococcota bacterium]